MFRATMCPSSGEITVFMRHLVFVTLCRWLSGTQGSTLHTRQSSTQSDKYQVSHRYNYFSWWWKTNCSQHVEKRFKRTKNKFAPIWLYLQDKLKVTSHHSTKSCTDSTATILFMATKLRTEGTGVSNPEINKVRFSKLSVLALRSTDTYILWVLCFFLR
jgi:hypothetical protein